MLIIATIQRIVAFAAVEVVTARATVQLIGIAIDRIRSILIATSIEEIVAGTAFQGITILASIKLVVTGTAIEFI